MSCMNNIKYFLIGVNDYSNLAILKHTTHFYLGFVDHNATSYDTRLAIPQYCHHPPSYINNVYSPLISKPAFDLDQDSG